MMDANAGVKVSGRSLFAWSGRNSDRDRREAATRLLEGMLVLEEKRRPYHLIGHSHGGTVIWNALVLAASKDRNLRQLKSWTTMGTPFPCSKPTSVFGSFALLLFTIPASLLTAAVVVYNLIQKDQKSYLNLVSYVAAVVVLAMAAYPLYQLIQWISAKIEFRRETLHHHLAWRTFRNRWLGVHSPYDETMAATYHSVDFRPTGLSRVRPTFPRVLSYRLPFQLLGFAAGLLWDLACAPVADILVNALAHSWWRGDDRAGRQIVYFSQSPVCLPEGGRDRVPDSLADVLLTEAVDQLNGAAAETFKEFSQTARSSGTSNGSKLKKAFAFEGVTPHLAYYHCQEIQDLIAYYIARKSGRGAMMIDKLRNRLSKDCQDWVSTDLDSQEYVPLPPPVGKAANPSNPVRRKPDRPTIWSLFMLFFWILVVLIAAVGLVGNDAVNHIDYGSLSF
jgi:hypothetical protein